MQTIKTSELPEVRTGEMEEIRQRRQQMGLKADDLSSEPGMQTNLVGLALSGGGLRSACFSLGMIQAFIQIGLWRFVDYLSTVSGGGYIGSYLTSYVVRKEKPLTRENCPLLPRANGGMKQPPDVQRFIYGGRYLVRPWQIANKYLIGLFVINVAIFSGLLAICAAVAFLWRSLDFDPVRDRVSMLGIDGLSGDAACPFWPFFVFTVCWLLAWMFSYWRRGAEAPGRFARFFLFFLSASFLVGLAILWGNGDVDLSFLRGNPIAEPWKPGGSLWATIGGLTLGGLLPFLTPRRLLQSGLHPQKQWEKIVFGIATTAALVGIPLLLVGYLAHENISGFNSHPYRPLLRADINQYGSLLHKLWLSDKEILQLRSPTAGAAPADRSDNTAQDLDDKEDVPRENNGDPFSLIRELYYFGTTRLPDHPWSADDRIKFDQEVREFRNELRAALEEGEHGRPITLASLFQDNWTSVDPKSPERERVAKRLKLLIAFREVNRVARIKDADFFGRDRYESASRATLARVRNLTLALQHLMGLANADNDASEIYTLQKHRKRLQTQLADAINTDVLNHHNLDISEPGYDAEAEQSEVDRREAVGLLSALLLRHAAQKTNTTASHSDPRALRRANLVKVASKQNLDLWMPQEVFELTTLLLESEYPQVFRPRSQAQRRTTLPQDQKRRIASCGGALLIFLVCGIWVDLNATSMHRFYRKRLTRMFIVPQRNKSESPALSELGTTRFGAPYHLISASTGLVLDRTGNEELPAGLPHDQGKVLDYRSVDSFLFSHRYCGSQLTGYANTDQYEEWIHGDTNRIDLAEATAISGAAVSPGQVSNWLVAFLMFMLNFRLGQWIPNPRRGRPRWRPTVLTLLRNLCLKPRNREYCFVTDGGNSENLGLIQLLRRRCSLIIQIDAGHDPQHTFTDLGRAIRTARVHGGVRLTSLDNPDEEFSSAPLNLSKLAAKSSPHEEDEEKHCEHHYAFAKIHYPDQTKGLLVYVKPSFTGDESVDLQQYRKRHPKFPHEPTSNQVYEHDQVESYRQLGYHIGEVLCRTLRVAGNLWECGARVTTPDLIECFEDAWRCRIRKQQEESGDDSTRERPTEAPQPATTTHVVPESVNAAIIWLRESKQPNSAVQYLGELLAEGNLSKGDSKQVINELVRVFRTRTDGTVEGETSRQTAAQALKLHAKSSRQVQQAAFAVARHPSEAMSLRLTALDLLDSSDLKTKTARNAVQKLCGDSHKVIAAVAEAILASKAGSNAQRESTPSRNPKSR